MEYDDDLMMSVLKIAEEFGNLDSVNEPEEIDRIKNSVEQFYVRGTVIRECFHVAVKKGFIQSKYRYQIKLTLAGRAEINRILNAQADRQRELARHDREKTKLWIDKLALAVSVISIFISGIALSVSMCNRYYPLPLVSESVVVSQQPVINCESHESDSNESESKANAHEDVCNH